MLRPAACDPIASRTDAASDHLYGRRKPIRRTNVWRCGTFSATTSSVVTGFGHKTPALKGVRAGHVPPRPGISFRGASARVGPQLLGGARRDGAQGPA